MSNIYRANHTHILAVGFLLTVLWQESSNSVGSDIADEESRTFTPISCSAIEHGNVSKICFDIGLCGNWGKQ